MKLSIILPEKNQAKRLLENLTTSIVPYFDALNLTYDVIISPNGCNDDDIAFLHQAELPAHVRILENGEPGKGNGVKQGILASESDYLLFMDADLATDLHIFDAILPELGSYDAFIASRDVKGSKYGRKQPFKRRMIHALSRWIIKMNLHLPFKDTQCGYKVFKTDVAKKMVEKQLTTGFAFDLEYLCYLHLNGYKVKELPCLWTDEPDSSITKNSVFTTFYKELKFIRKNKKKYIEVASEEPHAD